MTNPQEQIADHLQAIEHSLLSNAEERQPGFVDGALWVIRILRELVK